MPMTFKTPDGHVFESKALWRDYMMKTYYTFKDKVNEPDPLVKKPGDISGQVFDISDCQNSTMIVMDNCEQVQVDNCKRNCRIFIGACASAIFIRNCEDCVFYVCTKQLRIRESFRCKLYVMSVAEVHIEMSKDLAFAPFNGGYPEHSEHLMQAGIDLNHNLWYDVFDHNDPGKTRENWSLIPENEYENMWFPAGQCEPAIRRTSPGSVTRVSESDGMQAFGVNQLIADSKAPPLPSSSQGLPSVNLPTLPPVVANTAAPELEVAADSVEFEVLCVINSFVNYVPGTSSQWAADGLLVKLSDGTSALAVSMDGVQPNGDGDGSIKELWNVEKIEVAASGDFAYASFWVHQVMLSSPEPASFLVFYTGVCKKTAVGAWQLVHLHRSANCDPETISVPKME